MIAVIVIAVLGVSRICSSQVGKKRRGAALTAKIMIQSFPAE